MLFLKTTPGKIILATLALSSLTIFIAQMSRSFAPVRSVQAFVNGEIVSVRASIPGELALQSEHIRLGNQLEKGQQIGTIKSTVENPRVSVLRIDKQQLETRLQDIQQELFGVRQQIQNRTEQLNLFKQQAGTQNGLQINYARQQIKQYEGEVIRLQAAAKVARADAQRLARLAKQGAATLSNAENEAAKAQQASAAVQEARSKVEQANLSLEASSSGLQLEGTRTLSYPEIRVLELEAELTDLQQQEGNLKKQLQSARSQLFTARKELQAQQTLPVLVPSNSVVWSINSQPQEIVEANKTIIQLLNCQNLWVEAFINEDDASKLTVGQAAEINLNAPSREQWKGRVETIRAGAGRFEIGQYVVEPPPEITRRQLPVRVTAVRIKVDWQRSPNRGEFCLAGRSVNVRFLGSKSSSF